MSHQVNFYLLPEDLSEVEERLYELGPYVILRDRSSTSKPKVVDTLNLREEGRQWLYLYLARPEDVDSVITKYIPTQGYWSLDESASQVVELNGCFFDGQILRRGRLYYQDGRYGADGEWQDRPEAFRKWARSVLAKTKKLLRYVDSDYIGPNAAAWLAGGEGRKLVSV